MVNRKLEEIDKDAHSLFGNGRIKHDMTVKNAAHVKLVFNKEPMVQGNFREGGVTDFLNVNAPWSSDFYIYVYDKNGSADTSERQYCAMEEGHAPHAIVPIPFGLMEDEATWFNPRDYGKLEAVVTEAVAATCSILLEQVRPNVKLG